MDADFGAEALRQHMNAVGDFFAEISGDYWKYDEEKAVWIGKQNK